MRNGLRELTTFAEHQRLAIGDLAHLKQCANRVRCIAATMNIAVRKCIFILLFRDAEEKATHRIRFDCIAFSDSDLLWAVSCC